MDKRYEASEAAIKRAYFTEAFANMSQQPPIKAICLESGVNRATFYRHYSSIDELENSLFKEFMVKLVKEFSTGNYLFSNPEKFFEGLEKTAAENYQVLTLLKARGLASKMSQLIADCLKIAFDTVDYELNQTKVTFAIGGMAQILFDKRGQITPEEKREMIKLLKALENV
ncbi:MAG: hypothetical protein Q4F15_04685 [Bacillota bacterium]|nr:hypothetical protein [Bacillota bacterium]